MLELSGFFVSLLFMHLVLFTGHGGEKSKKLSLLLLNVKCVFVCHSVSVAELLSHSELDKDSDGVFTEAEARVYIFT